MAHALRLLHRAIHRRRRSLVAAAVAACLVGAWHPVRASDDKKLPAQPPPTSEDYRLGSGDKLRIEVYKDTQLSQSVQIRPDGKITLPLVGDLEATGRLFRVPASH